MKITTSRWKWTEKGGYSNSGGEVYKDFTKYKGYMVIGKRNDSNEENG